MAAMSGRQWAATVGGTAVLLVVLGVPTVLIPNGLFSREIEPTWWAYPVWLVTAVLGGLLLATYVEPRRSAACPRPGRRRGVGGGVLAWLAIGCPVCNKLVLLTLGASGALQWFAPLQPLLAVLGVVLLALALWTRLRRQPVTAPPGANAAPQRVIDHPAKDRSRVSADRTGR